MKIRNEMKMRNVMKMQDAATPLQGGLKAKRKTRQAEQDTESWTQDTARWTRHGKVKAAILLYAERAYPPLQDHAPITNYRV